MEFKDYYATLGLPRDASAADIKKAYRKLARQYHPDVSKAPDAAARMAAVNEAHTVLSDPERRAVYDGLGSGHHAGEGFSPPPGWGRGQGSGFGQQGFNGMDEDAFSDFFSQLFGHLGAAPHGPGRRTGRARMAHAEGGPQRGEDRHARLALDLADAWRGATRALHLQMPQAQPNGQVTMATRTLEVRIPAGVRPGQQIRLAGQGDPGQGGAPAGDLYLEVELRAEPPWHVDANGTVQGTLAVAPWEAALGGVVPLTLPDGRVLKVRVPAHAQAGRLLHVAGHGLPAQGGRAAGDLTLALQVVLPSPQDPRAKRLYEAMAQDLPDFDARKVAAADAPRGGGAD